MIDLLQSLAALIASIGFVFIAAIALSMLVQASCRWLDRYEKRGLRADQRKQDQA